MKKLIPLLLITLAAGLTNYAYALDPIPQTPGFSGFIRPGGGFMRYKSNLIAGNKLMDVGSESIDSLTDEPDSESTALFVFNFEAAYTFAGSRTQLTFGSQLEDIARLDLTQQLALKHDFPGGTLISLGFLLSGIPAQVWSDPYVTGTARQETDRESTGARLVLDRILGTAFEFTYTYRTVDIDEERSGEALGLSPPQRDLLRRDGSNHNLELSYTIDFEKRHRLIPGVFLYMEDRDGDAMSNWGTDIQLTYVFLNNPLILIVNGRIGVADYDEENPIYGKTQENDRYAAGIQLIYQNPFGWKPFGNEQFSVWATASYLMEDANIDFYDTEVSAFLAGVLFRF